MRVVFGAVLTFLSVALLFAVWVLSGIGNPVPKQLEIFSYSLLAMPIVVSVYIMFGGSRLTKFTHKVFLAIAFVPFLVATVTAIGHPSQFDLMLVLICLAPFGAVTFGILGFGHFRAPISAYADWIVEDRPGKTDD